MNDALDGLKTFGNPCKLTQLTQRVFCTSVEVVVMDVADQRLHVVVFWWKNERDDRGDAATSTEVKYMASILFGILTFYPVSQRCCTGAMQH